MLPNSKNTLDRMQSSNCRCHFLETSFQDSNYLATKVSKTIDVSFDRYRLVYITGAFAGQKGKVTTG